MLTFFLNSNRLGTPAAAAHQPTSLAEAELPATAAGSTPLHQASRLLRLALTAINLHRAAPTRAVQRLPLRTRPKPRVVTMVPDTTREREGCFWVVGDLYYVAPGRFIGYMHAWEARSSEFLVFSLFYAFEKKKMAVFKNKIEFCWCGSMDTISYEKQILYYYLFGQFSVPGPLNSTFLLNGSSTHGTLTILKLDRPSYT